MGKGRLSASIGEVTPQVDNPRPNSRCSPTAGTGCLPGCTWQLVTASSMPSRHRAETGTIKGLCWHNHWGGRPGRSLYATPPPSPPPPGF